MKLCDNCLNPAVGEDGHGLNPFPIGHDKGSQRDPYRVTLDLCRACTDALGGGDGKIDLGMFHARYTERRQVQRDQ